MCCRDRLQSEQPCKGSIFTGPDLRPFRNSRIKKNMKRGLGGPLKTLIHYAAIPAANANLFAV